MEPIQEQVAAALRTWLAGIVADGGTNYHYTPELVVRRQVYFDDDPPVDFDVVYLLRPGQTRHVEAGTGGATTVLAEFFLVVAKAIGAADMEPNDVGEVGRDTLAQRVAADAVRRLLRWRADSGAGGLRGLIENVADPDSEGGIAVDFERDVASHAVAELRFVVRFAYREAQS